MYGETMMKAAQILILRLDLTVNDGSWFVDLENSRVFMEKEHVFNHHQSAL